MGKFVNYKKRSFLLPSGAKDLIAMIKTGTEAEGSQLPQQFPRLIVRQDEFVLRPLRELRAAVAELLRPGPETRLLCMRSEQCAVTIDVHREASGDVEGSIVFPDDPQWERIMRHFFAEQRLQLPPQSSVTPTSFFPGVQTQSIYRIVPMPTDLERLVGVIQSAFASACNLTDDALIECRRFEGEYPT
jgi:hypothetical protein